MTFPQSVSLTITNACNLRCRMCGQWSEEGYIRGRSAARQNELGLADWKRIIDEIADHGLKNVLLRGGEVFLFPEIIPLLEHIRAKGIFASIDTNGTRLARYAADLVRIGNMHLTVSVDGPEEVHDAVRGVKGTFRLLRDGLARIAEEEKTRGAALSKSITFTISPYSYRALGQIPDVARSLGIGSICIVAYYFIPRAAGEKYETQLAENFGCKAFSWRGFHHEESGVDADLFLDELRAYHAALGGITDYPYFPMSENEYRTWFTDAVTPVGSAACANVEKLIDIQPAGEANFCVDFPDYAIGNVREATIAELWNSPRAEAFREYRRKQPLAVCCRCGAKYMAEIRGKLD
ncbi:MAG: radical SAM protein [Anaerolineales bacterium]|nr:radical SAM protein [Anaerolineales bacterium]